MAEIRHNSEGNESENKANGLNNFDREENIEHLGGTVLIGEDNQEVQFTHE